MNEIKNEGIEVNLDEDKKEEPIEVKPIVITTDHLKVIFHNQWLHTSMLFGILGLGAWILLVNLIDVVMYQLAAVLLLLLFLVIAYYKMYRNISPEHFLKG